MLGFFAGALTTASFAPQLLKCIRSKSTKDVSLGMLVSVSTGMVLWLIHGLMINDMALVVANSASLTLAIPLLCLKVRNDRESSFLRFHPERQSSNGDTPSQWNPCFEPNRNLQQDPETVLMNECSWKESAR